MGEKHQRVSLSRQLTVRLGDGVIRDVEGCAVEHGVVCSTVQTGSKWGRVSPLGCHGPHLCCLPLMPGCPPRPAPQGGRDDIHLPVQVSGGVEHKAEQGCADDERSQGLAPPPMAGWALHHQGAAGDCANALLNANMYLYAPLACQLQ